MQEFCNKIKKSWTLPWVQSAPKLVKLRMTSQLLVGASYWGIDGGAAIGGATGEPYESPELPEIAGAAGAPYESPEGADPIAGAAGAP